MRLTLLAAVVAVFVAPAAHACTCLIATPKTAFKQADAVFVGEVVSYEGDLATMRVVERFKGAESETIQFVSDYSNAACGYGAALVAGSRHLIYAYRDQHNVLSVSICSRTASEERASCDLRLLRSRAGWWRFPLSSLRILDKLRIRRDPCPAKLSADASLPSPGPDAPG